MRRHLTTILAADVVGFSRLIGLDEEGTLLALRAHRAELIDPLLAKHGGRIANTAGDSLLIEFPSAVEAVRFALAMQEGLAARNAEVSAERWIVFRIGINVGDVVAEGEDLLGDGVNVAARLEALAPPAGIILSRTARDQVRDRLDLTLVDLGEVKVRNIARAVRAFQVLREGESPIKLSKSKGLRNGLVAALVGLLLIGGGVIWYLQRPDFVPVDPANMALALPERPSIAVLPFVLRGSDTADAWIGDALTESLISTLSLSPDMLVIARNTVFSYKGKNVPVRDVARDLGVRYVLSGSVLKSGDTLRVTAELADALAGEQIWSLQEDRPQEDMIRVQDEISQKIFEELAVSLTVGEGGRGWLRAAGSFDNFGKVLKGRGEFQKFSPEGHYAAERIWSGIYEGDPDLAFANYLMGFLHWQKVILGLSKDPGHDWAEARRFGERALEIEEFGEGYTLLAFLAQSSGDFEQAIAYADRAVELAPGMADANTLAGSVKVFSGQAREGLALLLRGMRLEPDYPDWVPGSINWARLQLGQFEEVKALARSVLASDVKDVRAKPSAQADLVVAAVFEGDLPEARALARKLIEVSPSVSLESIRQLRGRTKDQDFVERYLDALRQAGIPESAN